MTNEKLDEIVADLRDEAATAAANEGDYYADQFTYHGCGEAADAITWLRAEVARLRGDAEAARLRLEAAQGETERLNEAIRRLADQDATLSVQGGNVTVTMDATLADEERGAIAGAIDVLEEEDQWHAVGEARIKTLRKLLERLA